MKRLAAWRQRVIERANARPKTKLDRWVIGQSEYILRLPKWLVGTWLISGMATGVWSAMYGRGLMPFMSRLYDDAVWAVLGTVSLTFLGFVVILLLFARRVPAPPNLPKAKVR